MTEPTAPATTPPDEVAGRQCSRCRARFPIEAGTSPFELIGWWTCLRCSDTLLPNRHRATVSST